ncbi:MAG: AlpA family phage regulatory protein [Porticoccaceae bacterium]|nr:AlpA family phage regulatory protein [Porticoccaceae bacterium]
MSKKNQQHLLRLPQILERIPISKSTWWAGVKDGKFPQPLRIGSRCTVWREEDIDQLIEEVSK